ncbi:MAG: hypothetical protein H7Y89_07580 [Steroidobacteraceae bacterium]|nr:hypothetical protein [Steroidobacteraceae bacterium]
MTATSPEKRVGPERRQTVLRALWRGNFERRRISPRRHTERFAVVTDWFHPQWLAVAIGILLLCCADALLTLTLITHGAAEINPAMAPLVEGSGHAFAYWKIGLTTMGVVLLTVLARLRVFGRAVGVILYIVLAAYVILVTYELFLLRNIPLD